MVICQKSLVICPLSFVICPLSFVLCMNKYKKYGHFCCLYE